MIKQKRPYSEPLVLSQVNLLLERDLLAGPSVVDHMPESAIKATGQELETYDFNSSFDHNWE